MDLLIFTTASSYIIAAGLLILGLFERWSISRIFPLSLAFIAVSAHTFLLYLWIEVVGGQNLTILNVFSLVFWLVSFLILVFSFRKPFLSFGILIFPLAALSIGLVNYFPSSRILNTGADPKDAIHIIFSLLALGILIIATCQVLFLAACDYQLRKRHEVRFLQFFPAIQTMERLLFQILTCGFILLTGVLVTSLWSYYEILGTAQVFSKTLLSISGWLLFGILLLGRYFFGWRGRKAIYWALAGMLLISFAYLSSFIILRVVA